MQWRPGCANFQSHPWCRSFSKGEVSMLSTNPLKTFTWLGFLKNPWCRSEQFPRQPKTLLYLRKKPRANGARLHNASARKPSRRTSRPLPKIASILLMQTATTASTAARKARETSASRKSKFMERFPPNLCFALGCLWIYRRPDAR
jgi:hypothetical protein